MTLIEISDGITWQDNNFLLKNKKSKYSPIVIEYLNSIDASSIQEELKTLKKFYLFLNENQDAKVDNFIQTQLEGYSLIEGKVSAKIAGAHDLAPSIYYIPANQNIIIVHPNVSNFSSTELSLMNLIELLVQKKIILNTVKILEKMK